MDFQSLSRRQLQALSKKNKIPANITNLAMADALSALDFVEGIDEIMNTLESEIPQSPMVPPTGGRTRTAKVAGTPAAAPTTATRRRAAAASTSVRRNIEASSEESLNEIEDVKKDVSMNTPAAAAPVSRRRAVRETTTVKPVYSTRRSARLVQKIEEPKERPVSIKMNSFTEEVDQNVEVEMKENSVEQSEVSEITVLDNFKECSEEREVKSNDESTAISEEKVNIPNEDVAIASIEGMVASDIKTVTVQEEDLRVDGFMKEDDDVEETRKKLDDDEGLIEETEMNPNVNEENEASTEKDTEMSSTEKDTEMSSTKASFEVTEMKSNVDGETKASTEKDTEMSSNMEEDAKASFVTKMKSNVDDETKALTDMNSTGDEDIVVAEFRVADSSNVENEHQFNHDEQSKEHEHYAGEIENDGEKKPDMPDENQSSNDDESMGDENDDILVPEIDIQDELLNSEAKHVSNLSAIGDAAEPFTCVSDPIHIAAPLNHDELVSSIVPLKKNSLSKTPIKKFAGEIPITVGRPQVSGEIPLTVGRPQVSGEIPLTVGRPQVSDDKENVDNVRKSVILKDEKPLKDRSLRELTRMFKDKLAISKQQKKESDEEEDIKATTTTRPALKSLSDNCMLVEPQN